MRLAHQQAWLARLFLHWGVLLFALHALCGAEMPKVVFVQIDETTADFFDDPPSPLDYAAFLKNVQKHEPRCVGVVDLLHWPQVAPEILNGLITQAKSLNVVYAAMLDNDAPDPDIAESLSAFPQDFVATGDLSDLSSFKSVRRLPVEGLLENSAAGFTIIDFGIDMKVTASGIEVPLLARGPNSELAISLPLLIAGQALGLSWNTALIDIGTAVQLGDGAEPIPLDRAGKVVVPLEAPSSLQRLGGERLIAAEDNVEAALDAVLIVGSDLERDRVFPLTNGERVSRTELVSRTVCYLLEKATAAPVPPPSDPAPALPETTLVVPVENLEDVGVEKPNPPSTYLEVYQFPDLRAPNIGLWILGISGGLALGCVLLLAKPKQDRSEPEEGPKEVPDRVPAKPEITERPGGASALTKKREMPRKDQSTVKGEEKREAENEDATDDTPSGDDASPMGDASLGRAAPPEKSNKRPARKKRSRTRRRRPS